MEEAQEITEFAEMLYNFREAMDIKSIKANIQSFLLANHYRKLPKDRPEWREKIAELIPRECDDNKPACKYYEYSKCKKYDNVECRYQREIADQILVLIPELPKDKPPLLRQNLGRNTIGNMKAQRESDIEYFAGGISK